jgi:hypothetical protein
MQKERDWIKILLTAGILLIVISLAIGAVRIAVTIVAVLFQILLPLGLLLLVAAGVMYLLDLFKKKQG